MIFSISTCVHQTLPDLAHSDSGYESQFKLQSQPSGTAVANDEVDTVDFESPVNIYSTPLPPPVKPLFPLKDRPDIGKNMISEIAYK